MDAFKGPTSGNTGEQDSITQMVERAKSILCEPTTDRDRAHQEIQFQEKCTWSPSAHELAGILLQLDELGATKRLQEATQASDTHFWPQITSMAKRRMQEKPQIQLCQIEQRSCLATCH